MAAGLTLMARNVPRPDNVTACGELGPSSVNVKVPLALMAVCGVKVRLTVQDEDGASVVPQVFALIAK